MLEAMARARIRAFFQCLTAFGLAAACATFGQTAHARTLYFPHEDARFLHPNQKNGGAVVLPEVGSEEALPLVVFLHGTNSAGDLHLWLGGGRKDLRPAIARFIASGSVRPFVFAAPSHTKHAALPRKVWSGFELHAFIEDAMRATEGQVKIDRNRVVLAGHSGAGCNPSGGLSSDYWSAGAPLPVAVVSVDPCLDGLMGAALSRRPVGVPLLLWWQRAVWVRQPAKFTAALLRDRPEERVDRVTELPAIGPNPHDAILPVALETSLRELLGTAQAEEQAQEPRSSASDSG